MPLMIPTILAQLTELAGERNGPGDMVRRHLHAPGILLYVRIGPRYCGGQLFQALVLADTTIDADLRGQGRYTQLLTHLEARALALGLQVVVHENVTNPRLLQFLLRQGCRPVRITNDTLFKELHP